jgi:hypothetical protein
MAARRGNNTIKVTAHFKFMRRIETICQVSVPHTDDRTSEQQLQKEVRNELGRDAAVAAFCDRARRMQHIDGRARARLQISSSAC